MHRVYDMSNPKYRLAALMIAKDKVCSRGLMRTKSSVIPASAAMPNVALMYYQFPLKCSNIIFNIGKRGAVQ